MTIPIPTIKIITFDLECEEPVTNTRRKMTEVQKASFTRATRAIANNIVDRIPTQKCDVTTLEELSTQHISDI